MSIYLKSDDIPGAIEVKGFEKTFELTSLAFGQSRSINSRIGNTGKIDSRLANVTDLSFTKNYDVASTKLYAESFSGKLLAKMVISLTRQDKDGVVTFSEITIEDVIISGYNVAAGSDGEPAETVTLNYGKISIKNTPPGKDGTAGTPSTTGWNLMTNTKI